VVRGLIDHAPALAPDLHFRLLKNPQVKRPLSSTPNVTEQSVLVGANSPASMWFLPELADLSGCDVFHAVANILPARLPMQTVTSVHDIMWLSNPDWCDPSAYGHVKRRFYGQGIRRALSKSDKIAVVSEATKNAILERFPECAERIAVTRSGVSPRFRRVDNSALALSRLDIAKDAQFALVVGQFAPYKNHEGALRAFARAFAGQEDKILVLVQRQGPRTQELEAAAQELGVARQVRFTGPVDESLLLQLYSAAKFLVHPSFCEGFGNPIAEAMGCGCPVITSDLSAMPEVAGGAAKLVDPACEGSIADAMIEVWNDKQKADTMRAAGIKRAAELRWHDFARKNVAIYRSILAET